MDFRDFAKQCNGGNGCEKDYIRDLYILDPVYIAKL
jgi:hypothetical protein